MTGSPSLPPSAGLAPGDAGLTVAVCSVGRPVLTRALSELAAGDTSEITEVRVVDNTKDGSLEREPLADLLTPLPLRVLRGPGGTSGGRNLAIEQATTDVVLFFDDACLPYMHEKMVPPMTHAQYRDWAQLRIDALNHALKGIPPERSRYHICWGSWNGPHAFDVPMKDIVDLMLQVNVGAYQFEAANPRHEHEWVVWQSVKLPPGKVLIPGVISHATNIVEHPELVAQRIVRLANIVGRENVMGGTDCGFAQSPFAQRVHPTIMWAKLKSLAEGAKIATNELWGRRSAA